MCGLLSFQIFKTILTRHYLVYGLLFGPRGTPSEAAVAFFKAFQLEDTEQVATRR